MFIIFIFELFFCLCIVSKCICHVTVNKPTYLPNNSGSTQSNAISPLLNSGH